MGTQEDLDNTRKAWEDRGRPTAAKQEWEGLTKDDKSNESRSKFRRVSTDAEG